MVLHLPKPNGFSLAAASTFYASFTPGSGMAAADAARLTLAFRLDRSFEAVAVGLRDAGPTLAVDVAGTDDHATVARQVSRILGLEADGDAWREVGRRDPVVGRLQADYAGFFTAAKASPYDAATWGILVQRLPMKVAARLKMRMAAEHGDAVTIGGRTHAVFPRPERVLALDRVEGLADEKLARLRSVAEAALEGRLDAERLRAMPADDALAELQRIRGVGPWTAGHVYFRGAAPTDALPTIEPRVLHGWAHAAGIERPTMGDFVRASEAWRPFRMWVAILCSRHLSASGGWHAPGLREERGRAIARARRATEARA